MSTRKQQKVPRLEVGSYVIRLRWFFIVGVQAGIICASLWFAVLVRFDFRIPEPWIRNLYWVTPLDVGITLAALHFSGALTGLWRYVTLQDAARIGAGCGTGFLVLLGANEVAGGPAWLPRSTYLLAAVFAFIGLTAVRAAVRLTRERWMVQPREGTASRTLVVGAGDAAFQLVREVREKQRHRYDIIGFLDDDPAKLSQDLVGCPVLGRLTDLCRVVESLSIEEVMIAMPSAGGTVIRRIQGECQALGIPVQSLPGISSLLDGRVTISQVRPVSLEDLLRRPEVQLDRERVSEFIRGKRVLVTGAGGSIGSEICRQIARFSPAQIVLFDQAETPLHAISIQLAETFAYVPTVSVLGSIACPADLDRAFAEPVNMIFHAAAYKHVPMIEANPLMALSNNIAGTKLLAEHAIANGISNFIMISTDKAVRPSSVMGASKRVCEMLLQSLAARAPETVFATVRFGNVLGSNGSVVPRFQDQIRRGGPVTITHPEIERFFMTIPEASQLVLQAATMGKSGDILILDMGKPLKILDLARDLIRLSGFVPGEDIEIVFTGLRPGEKMYEELLFDSEEMGSTPHSSILLGRTKLARPEQYAAELDRFITGTPDLTEPEIRSGLAALCSEGHLASLDEGGPVAVAAS